MKRKFSDRANWRRIIGKSYNVIRLDEADFKGYVALYQIHEIREPLWKTYNGKELCLADNGYKWLQHFPDGKHYVVTTMYDNRDKVVQWYIDICLEQGVTDQGVPWFYDLYLDIIVLSSGEMMLMDREELDEALAEDHIAESDHALAIRESELVLEAVRSRSMRELHLSDRHLQLLLNEGGTR